MNKSGIYNESEMIQRTCKMVRLLRVTHTGQFAGVNRDSDGNKALIVPNLQESWDKCEGSMCAHWRWYKRWPFSKVQEGGLGYCGLAGGP